MKLNLKERFPVVNHLELFSLVMAAAFFLFGLWFMGFHETWRDEYQAWLIADSAGSLNELIQNHKYEGQPILWHLILWMVSSVGLGFGAVKVFHLLIAAICVGLICRFSPFSKPAKLLLALSYYLLFEYTMIVRPYGLALLGLILFCVFYEKKNRSLVWMALCIALVANTQTYGVVLAGWLVMLWGVKLRDKKNETPFGEKLTGGFIMLTGIAIALFFIYPEADNGFINPAAPTFEAWKALEVFDGYFRSYFPLPKLDAVRFWNSNIVDPLPRVIVGFSGFALMALWGFIFRKDKKIMLAFFAGTTLFLLTNYYFAHYPFVRNYRHAGHYFMILLVCYWLFGTDKNPKTNTRQFPGMANAMFVMILASQVIASLLILKREVIFTFSNSQAAAAFLSTADYPNLPMLNRGDAELTSIAGATGRPVYYLNRNAYGTFAVWKKFEELSDAELVVRINRFLEESGYQNCLYIATAAMPTLKAIQNVKEVAVFDEANTSKESFFVYSVGTRIKQD